MKRFILFLLMVVGLLSGRASGTWSQFLTVETDTAEYVTPKDTTIYLPPVDTTHYEPVDTGEVVRPDVPGKPVIYVPTIQEGDNVTEFPHNPAVDDMLSSVKPAKQEFAMTIEGEYLRIKGTLMARGYGKHYIHCQIIGDSVHLQRFDMDPESTDMILHNVDIRIPGFTEDYYKVTLAEQNDVPLYKQYMMMAKAVTRGTDTNHLDYTPSIIGSVWSYTDFNGVKEITQEEEVIYHHSFTRYTVTDDPIMFNEKTYYTLMEYKACEYQPEEAVLVAYLRQDKDKIYKYTAADNSEVLLYDFSLNSEETVRISEQNIPITIGEKNTIKSVDNIDFEKYSMIYWVKDDSNNWEGNITNNEWIRYIGGVRDFLEEYKYSGNIYVTTTVGYGRMLNYYRSGDGKVVYKNGLRFWNWTYDDFMEDDCAIPNKIEDIIKVKSQAIIQTTSSSLLCTAPDAVKLEVYTMDAVKVGEARFVDGKAAVKVGEVPATYLYIVTYPDGRRESGKTVKN